MAAETQTLNGQPTTTTAPPGRERRLMILSVSPRAVVDVLRWYAAPQGSVLMIPDVPDLPADVEVVGVTANYERQSLDVLVRHDSFGPVPEGDVIPRVPAWNVRQRVLEKPYQLQEVTP